MVSKVILLKLNDQAFPTEAQAMIKINDPGIIQIAVHKKNPFHLTLSIPEI